jgi:Tfp pilus assembly protein PilF
MQGRLDKAKALFLESMQLDPKDANAHLHYAICLSARRQAREAMAEYHKALALDDKLSMAYIVFRINNGYISRTVVWLGA